MRMLARFALGFVLAVPSVRAEEVDGIGGHDEAWWRAAATARQLDLSRREAEVERCEEREAPPAYDRIDGYVTANPRDGRPRWVEIARCDEERAAVDRARDELERFEDEARKLEVPPGWLR